MNTLKKVSLNLVLGALVATSAAAPASAADVFGGALPDLSAVTTEISRQIATELRQQLRNALTAPRAKRVRTPPSVTVIDTETVMVEASRLPPLDGSDNDAVRTAQLSTSARF